MLSSSLNTDPAVFGKDFTCLLKVFQCENYVRVWSDSKVPFWKLYLNSLTVSVVGTLGQLLLSSLAGYALAKLRFRGKNFVFLLMMITMMIPGQATIIPRYMMFFSVGLYDTLWALILPSFFSISSIFLLRQFYLGLPNDLMEAARVDGANTWQLFRYIQVPAIMLMVDFVLFDNIRGALQVFDIPFVMTAGGPGYASSTFTLYTIKTAFTFSNFGLASTMAVAIMFMIVAIYIVQNFLIHGLILKDRR